MIRTKYPESYKAKTTADGRILGSPLEDLIPEEDRHIFPENPSPFSYSSKMAESKQIHKIARRLMPTGLEQELKGNGDEIVLDRSRIQIRTLSQARFNALSAAIRLGMPQDAACKFAGISTSTYDIWMKRGREGEMPYVIIHDHFKKLEAELEAELISAIVTAGTKREFYVETMEEHKVDEHGVETKKTRRNKRAVNPTWGAAAWMLERRDPAFRLDKSIAPDDSTNTPEEDLLMMDGTSMGLVKTVPKQEIVNNNEDTNIDRLAGPEDESGDKEE